ncbi:arrestin domain-containing protein F [Papilio machaon]|uniref:arrestin domain-containing protein F n=1 Tax=Papilio machaon TaxID=76193 RepID=UPI001E66514A|nr:arrestin domain-containing protein F [Papilio machaon]
MYIKFVVFYTVVFSLKSALSGVNIHNGLNLRNTHQMYLNNQHNVQNDQNTYRPLDLSSFARNNNNHEPILRQQQQNIKIPSYNPSLLPHRPPLNKVPNQIPNVHVLLPNKRVDNFYNSGNQFAVTLPKNYNVQNNLKREVNGYRNRPENFKVTPVLPVVEHKDVERTTNGLLENKNGKILMPVTVQPVSRVPHIDVNKELLNKLTPQLNNIQRSVINDALDRQKPTINHQNVFSQGNIQPQRTLLNPRNNLQRNHYPQNKRFTVIHDNGYVEYFDNLETILRKYPHVRIADNILKLIPNRNHNIPQSKPLTHNSDSNANIKINLPLEQQPKLLNKSVPTQTMLHTSKRTQNPKIETNIQKKDTSLMNKSNDNFGTLQTSTLLPITVDNKKSENLKSSNIPMKLQENKEMNFITTAENIVKIQSTDVSNKNNKTTPLKNRIPSDGNKQKPPIDVILNSEQKIPHQENKTNISPVISNNKYEHSENVTKLQEDLHLNKSKEVKTPIVVQNKTENKTVSTYESKPEIIKKSSLNNDTVDKIDGTQSNCTKQYEVKNKLKPQRVDEINQKDKGEMDDDYDEDLLSLVKPVMWFSTTDPEFWKKLVSVDENPNFIYIINVQSQPKIEKDRKTMIHANGTIVEEITETIWDAGDDVPPKIIKTIKVTPANAVSDGA